jgi:hypothetical protein
LKEVLIPNLLKLLHKIWREKVLSNSLYEASIALLPKLDEDNTKQFKWKPYKSNSLLNTEILNKILANGAQQQIKTYTWFHSRNAIMFQQTQTIKHNTLYK